MNPQPKILIVSPDATLPGELASALRGCTEVQPVTHTVPDHRQGVEAARSRHPDLVLVEMTRGDLRRLKVFTEEVAAAAPDAIVTAAFSPDLFGHDVSESAILIEAMRAGVRDFLRRPLSSADLRQLLDRLLRTPAALPTKLGKVIAFVSNKGGVGKSTLAVSVACELAGRHRDQVLLIDGSLQMGVCATMLDLKPAATLTDAVRERQRLDTVLVRQLATPHACGLHLLAAPADALEAAEIDDELMSRVLNLARRAYEYVVVDSFPLLDRVMMAVLDVSDLTYLVTDSLVPTVLGAAKLIEVLDRLGLPAQRQQVVLNRYVGFTGDLRPADVAGRLGRGIDHVVPYEKRLLPAANLGQPYILRAGRFFAPWARAIRAIAAGIEQAHLVVPVKVVAPAPEAAAPPLNGVLEKEQVRS